MTALLEQAVKTARNLPAEMQDDIARMVLLYTGGEETIVDLTPDEEAAVLRSRAAAGRGEFASDDQMQAIWARHGL